MDQKARDELDERIEKLREWYVSQLDVLDRLREENKFLRSQKWIRSGHLWRDLCGHYYCVQVGEREQEPAFCPICQEIGLAKSDATRLRHEVETLKQRVDLIVRVAKGGGDDAHDGEKHN